MDDDIDLICRLATRAGMIMEDVSPQAILMGSKTGQARTAALITLAQAGHSVTALLSAALALDQLVSVEAVSRAASPD